MTIGLDLSSLQGPHRMRGVGYTLINFINNIPANLRTRHKFVFYFYTEGGYNDPLELLDLNGIEYEVRPLESVKKIGPELPGRLHIITRLIHKITSLRHLYLGDPRIRNLDGVEVFLQTDQMVSVPKAWRIKKAFIAYDVIPYVLESDYLWGYGTARAHGRSRQLALRHALRRWEYVHKLRTNARRSDKVLAISRTTQEDFARYVKPSRKKIVTIPLGINQPRKGDPAEPQMHRYIDTSWGYLKRSFKLDKNTRFLLFVGGSDYRRKLDDLVVAFNHLRAQGYELKLVLAGDIMRGPGCIPIKSVREELEKSSYADDIIFMGFVDDEQRDWLYTNALAFVFPSWYEGFGLPVLEAMSYDCPVISYRNDATIEVAGDTPTYTDGPQGIVEAVSRLINKGVRKRSDSTRLVQARKFNWQTTSTMIINELEV